jgi:hypothetical protein
MLLTNVAKIDIPTTHAGSCPSAAVKASALRRLRRKKLQPKSVTPPMKRKKMI